VGGVLGVWRRVVGIPAAAALTLGAVSVAVLVASATPASAATDLVTTEAQFRADFNSNSFDTLVLQNDIHLTGCTPGSRAARTTANNPLTVDGQGQFKIVQDCDGFGVLTVPSPDTSNVTLRGVTITGAHDSGDGGGIEFEGTNLTIDHSTFINNHTSVLFGDDGGGVDFEGTGTLTVTGSTFANNSAADDGGGVNCDSPPASGTGHPMTVTGSTFTANSTLAGQGDSGGAIDMEVQGCALTMTNSTVTANTSGDDAAITSERSAGPVTLVYDSIVNNATAPASPGPASIRPKEAGPDDTGHDKPGVHAENDTAAVATANLEAVTPSSLTVFGTVVAHPHGGPNCSDATGAPLAGISSAGYNLADDTSCGLTNATDKQAAGLDPKLGALANNGGPTQTLLPLTGSPLIDAIAAAACQSGPAAGITVDQRGVARPQGPGCDIGAVEVVVPLVVQPRFTG